MGERLQRRRNPFMPPEPIRMGPEMSQAELAERQVINDDDVLNVKIALGSANSVEELLAAI
jgi:hypothetical protein